MRLTHTYEMGKYITEREKEEKDMGAVIQDDLSPEKHINRISGDHSIY